MSDSLCVSGYAVVLLMREVDVLGAETGEHSLDAVEGVVRGAVFDEDERLAFGVDIRPVERVAGYNVDVFGEMSLEGGDFGGFAGGLAADYGAFFGS